MTLIKTSLFNSIAVLVKILTLLGINKILAVYVGPAGYAALGQFQNAMTIITTFASGALNTGVTKYTAEYVEDELKQITIWKTAGTLAIGISVLFSLLVAVFSVPLAKLFLGDAAYASVFLCFSVALSFFVLNALLLAILVGKKEVPRYVMANIVGSLLSIGFVFYFVMLWGAYGALIALATFQSVAFFITLIICWNLKWFKISNFYGKIDKGAAKNLSKFALMAIVSAACVPVSQILVRQYVVQNLGVESAGYWEALWRLSSAYLMLVTTVLSVYYLPKLAELKTHAGLRSEIVNGAKIIVPVTIVGAVSIYALRVFIVEMLFSKQFLPIEEIMGWQLFGDVLKIASWLVAYVFISRAEFKIFIFIEIFFSITFVLLSMLLVSEYGLVGGAYAHIVNYVVCLIFVMYKFSKLKVL
ncbi:MULTISPECIES: O-antigen translocase [Pseudomonas]|uniref:O-antigen translocase n=5 Tax=Pseudomonas TaxID=286 RepID=A0A7Y1LD34_9PSED|nr:MULTISPECIES: O-antigen translocase [Pseudomonas]MBI6978323.1 O-antigen translocase [Pseudomonas lactis]MCF5003344.1 oligosaccharide flippase family protein [Pseudomonas lactis]MCF5013929.1 oligosaccharide flippase family protein [Pseudomonas lactis]MCF5037618.1 oligosaccharide flippase family protein [Pseudomonas lactis]MCF5082594.1 oligosaccharide flippase family protein [Pseudomonas lactis]